MQAGAICEAVAAVQKGTGETVVPEVMIRLIYVKKEVEVLRELGDKVAEAVRVSEGVAIDYLVGTMIELPRACLRAAEIAEGAEFFSFGTNDLTQTTFGLSRDDAGNFLGRSEEHTSDLQSLMRISYAVLCLKKKKHKRLYNLSL